MLMSNQKRTFIVKLISAGDALVKASQAIECLHNEYGETAKDCKDCYELQKAIDNWNSIKMVALPPRKKSNA